MSMHAALGVDLIDVFAGGHLDQGALQELSHQSEVLRASTTGAAAQFFDQARSLYSVISSSDATQILRNLKAKTEDLWSQNTICRLDTLKQLQTAGPVMQRWIMANPTVREMYLANECEGYGDSYTNVHGNTIGASHYDWRRVMDTLVRPTEDGYVHTQYHEKIGADEPELTLYQRADILRTWAMVDHYVDEHDEDPTSVTGNKL